MTYLAREIRKAIIAIINLLKAAQPVLCLNHQEIHFRNLVQQLERMQVYRTILHHGWLPDYK